MPCRKRAILRCIFIQLIRGLFKCWLFRCVLVARVFCASKNVIAEIENLIDHYRLDDVVTLKGIFCLECCSDGVTVMIGKKVFTKVTKENVVGLFENEVFTALYGKK